MTPRRPTRRKPAIRNDREEFPLSLTIDTLLYLGYKIFGGGCLNPHGAFHRRQAMRPEVPAPATKKGDPRCTRPIRHTRFGRPHRDGGNVHPRCSSGFQCLIVGHRDPSHARYFGLGSRSMGGKMSSIKAASWKDLPDATRNIKVFPSSLSGGRDLIMETQSGYVANATCASLAHWAPSAIAAIVPTSLVKRPTALTWRDGREVLPGAPFSQTRGSQY